MYGAVTLSLRDCLKGCVPYTVFQPLAGPSDSAEVTVAEYVKRSRALRWLAMPVPKPYVGLCQDPSHRTLF